MRPAAATATLGLGLVLAAGLFDAEPLYVPGLALLLLPLAAVTWVALGARGVRIERAVAARRVAEEHPVEIVLTVRSGKVALPAGHVEDDLLPAPAPLAPGRRETRVRIRVRFGRRGRRVLAPPRVVVRDPFGLASRAVAAAEPVELLVLPRVEPVVTPHGEAAGAGLAARRGRPAVAAEIDLDGLRPYREGAAASRIFWPALARGGGLMERRLRADGDARPLVVLDPRAPGSAEDLDAAVRAVASLCVALAREGGCSVLLPGDRRPSVLEPTLAGWPHLHARLAVVDDRAAPTTSGLSARRGPVLLVLAHAPARTPRALAHAPGGGRLLVVPGTLPGRRPAFTVAGCTGYELSGPSSTRRRRPAPAGGGVAA